MRTKGFLVAAVMALVVPGANADMVLILDDAATAGFEEIISDNELAGFVTDSGLVTTADDTDPTVGVISFSGVIGLWIVNSATALGMPLIGPPAQIHLDSIDVSSSTLPGTMTISMTDTGFGPLAAPSSLLSGFGGTTDGTVTSLWTADETNIEFGLGGTASSTFGPFTPFPLTAFSFNGVAPSSIPITGLFSLTNIVTIDHGGSGVNQTTSFDSSVMIPVPGALLLGSLGLGMVGWLKRRFA